MLRTTIAVPRLDVEANRHHEVDEAAGIARLDEARAQRADQLEDEVVGLRALETVAQELGVESDLERLALERDGQRLARLADVRRLRGDLERPFREAHAQ